MPIVEFENVTGIYTSGDHVQKALDSVILALRKENLLLFSVRAEPEKVRF